MDGSGPALLQVFVQGLVEDTLLRELFVVGQVSPKALSDGPVDDRSHLLGNWLLWSLLAHALTSHDHNLAKARRKSSSFLLTVVVYLATFTIWGPRDLA